MKTTIKRKSVLISVLAVLAAVIACVIAVKLSANTQPAQAETYYSADNYTFTLVTDDSGNQSYKVAIKSTSRVTVTTAIVPDTYKGLPVTELATGAFISCSKLTTVVLPSSIKTIGNNAFMNCAKLEVVLMPGVQSIGTTAFSMCSALDRLYIPQSVKTVGANILKGNANTVFVQSAEEDLGDGWSSTWNANYSGKAVFSVSPEAAIEYTEIKEGDDIVGYEICERQTISVDTADVVIYNAYRPNESLPYLPILNICPEAFTFVSLNSLTIKDRPEDDESFPVFNHKINISSNAFLLTEIKSVNIEADVTFNHPQDLQADPAENVLGEPITGDKDGHSVGVFENAFIRSITLPASLPAIYDKMFYECVSLKEIKIAGQEYTGINMLPNVTSVGNEAFKMCVGLRNINIPSTVKEMGRAVFDEWGNGEDYDILEEFKQEINIDLLHKQILGGWDEEWDYGIDYDNAVVKFLDVLVKINLCDEDDETIALSVIPGENLPNIEVPTRTGYEFKGVFSQPNGNGVQYYTSGGVGVRVWNDGDPTVLYADWEAKSYDVGLESNGNITYVKAYFGQAMPATNMPTKRGYKFCGYYYFEDNGSKTFYYNSDMSSARDWDRDYNCVLHAEWQIIVYSITYGNLKDGVNPTANPTTYTVESAKITLAIPYGRKGYKGSWDTSEIDPSVCDGDQKINAVWTPIVYSIEYKDDKNGTNPNAHIKTFTIETPTIVFAPPYGVEGYKGRWDPPSIPQGSTGDDKTLKIEVRAVWTAEDYEIKYENVLESENPNKDIEWFTIESDTIVFKKPYGRKGYTGDWDIKEIPHGSTGHKVITAVWTPIPYSITYEISYGINPNEHIKKYTIEDEINFAPPYGRDHYIGSWDTLRIPKGTTGDKKITAIWTPIQYTITYKYVPDDLVNNNPKLITYFDVVELSFIDRSGYVQIGWKLNKEYVYTLSNIDRNIEIDAVWSDRNVINVEADLPKLNITVDNMTINLPSNNFNSNTGLCITVQTNVTTLTMASSDSFFYYMNLDLSKHYSNFTLILKSVRMKSAGNSIPTINLPSHTLTLKTSGTCNIYGADGKYAQYYGDSTTRGCDAIICGSLNIMSADNLSIKGGNGGSANGKGSSGGNGGFAVRALVGDVCIYTNNVSLIGGYGGNALYGSTSYGHGSEATNATVYHSGYTVNVVKGKDGAKY